MFDCPGRTAGRLPWLSLGAKKNSGEDKTKQEGSGIPYGAHLSHGDGPRLRGGGLTLRSSLLALQLNHHHS